MRRRWMKEANSRSAIVAGSARARQGDAALPLDPLAGLVVFRAFGSTGGKPPGPPRSMRGGLEQADAFGGGGEGGGWGAGSEDTGGGDLGAGALESLDEIDVGAAFGALASADADHRR